MSYPYLQCGISDEALLLSQNDVTASTVIFSCCSKYSSFIHIGEYVTRTY